MEKYKENPMWPSIEMASHVVHAEALNKLSLPTPVLALLEALGGKLTTQNLLENSYWRSA